MHFDETYFRLRQNTEQKKEKRNDEERIKTIKRNIETKDKKKNKVEEKKGRQIR